jgi:putative flavoprotein involved in K+ transport
MDAIAGRSSPAEWLTRFDAALGNPHAVDWASLFAESGYWRDLLAFSWTIVTIEGPDDIATMARAQAAAIVASAFAIDPALSGTDEAWFDFETATARCKGYVKLEDGRAAVLMTAATALRGFEEPAGARRPQGIEHRAQKKRRTWLDERKAEEAALGYDRQPYCLIVGGGQNGLALAARLKRLNVPTLVIDAHEKPGDAWRKRYRSLYLHDPIFLDHFPYLPFPDHWPLYTSKDKMGDWLEIYARVMEINFWGSTRCTHAHFDEAAGEWTVTVERDGATLTLQPKQLVLATGLSGSTYVPEIPGADSFTGSRYHAAAHQGGEDVAGRHCVVVGSNNSAHDICVDLWENDAASVTMIQRSPTVVVRAATMQALSADIPYAKDDIPTEMVDLMGATVSFRARTAQEIGNTAYLRDLDSEFYARLAKSGFQLSHGIDGSGFFFAYYRRAAGYYIDVGASDLLADGEIALAQGEIAAIEPAGVRMADGTFLPADLIVYATGYRPMAEWVGTLISPEVQEKVGACWGLGSDTPGDPGPWEGELRNMWKPTRQPNLWFQGGNLMQSRFHSLHLALQIKARMEGLPTPVFWPAAAAVHAAAPEPA